jgi:hypothetical protein
MFLYVIIIINNMSKDTGLSLTGFFPCIIGVMILLFFAIRLFSTLINEIAAIYH